MHQAMRTMMLSSIKPPTENMVNPHIHHFGSVKGIEVGMSWKNFSQLATSGVHRDGVKNVHGQEKVGAYSLVVASSLSYDKDDGDEFIFNGAPKNIKIAGDQEFRRTNLALARNCNSEVSLVGGESQDWRKGKPVRVVRCHLSASPYGPTEGYRYDGIYKVVSYWSEVDSDGFITWKYKLRRDDKFAAPWTEVGKNLIERLGFKMQVIDEAREKRKRERDTELAKGGNCDAKKKRIPAQKSSPKRAASLLQLMAPAQTATGCFIPDKSPRKDQSDFIEPSPRKKIFSTQSSDIGSNPESDQESDPDIFEETGANENGQGQVGLSATDNVDSPFVYKLINDMELRIQEQMAKLDERQKDMDHKIGQLDHKLDLIMESQREVLKALSTKEAPQKKSNTGKKKVSQKKGLKTAKSASKATLIKVKKANKMKAPMANHQSPNNEGPSSQSAPSPVYISLLSEPSVSSKDIRVETESSIPVSPQRWILSSTEAKKDSHGKPFQEPKVNKESCAPEMDSRNPDLEKDNQVDFDICNKRIEEIENEIGGKHSDMMAVSDSGDKIEKSQTNERVRNEGEKELVEADEPRKLARPQIRQNVEDITNNEDLNLELATCKKETNGGSYTSITQTPDGRGGGTCCVTTKAGNIFKFKYSDFADYVKKMAGCSDSQC